MELPFAVYTAREGYGWACGLEHGRAALERYRKALGKFPEADYGDAMTRGAVNAGDTVVAYRFLTAEHWDSKGRNALYLAMTFFPRTAAGEINIEHLLGMDVFTKPMREPPSSLDYCGGVSAGAVCDPEADAGGKAGAKGFNLSNAGRVFQKAFPGTFRIWRSDGESGFSCTYTPPAPVNAGPSVVSAPETPPTGSASPAPDVPEPAGNVWLLRRAAVVAAAVTVCLAAGYCVWMKPDLFRAEKATPADPAILEGGKPGAWDCWPVGADGYWRGLSDVPPFGACCGATRIRGAHD